MESLRSWQAPDGARISYALWRGGASRPVLVLLHGLASNHTRWNEFTKATTLRDTWDVLRIDRRGQAGSTWRGAIGMSEWCDDIAGILASEGYAQAVVGGHCLGANVALAFAALHPGRTAGLVLVEPMPQDALIGTMARTARLRPLLHLLAGMASALNALGLYRRTLPALDLEALDQQTRATEGVKAGVLDLYASPLFDLKSTPSAAYFRDLLAVTGPLPDFATIRAPALALLSRHSTFTDIERTRAALERLPHVKIAELEAKHWIPTEQPAAMREAIETWLARLLSTVRPA